MTRNSCGLVRPDAFFPDYCSWRPSSKRPLTVTPGWWSVLRTIVEGMPMQMPLLGRLHCLHVFCSTHCRVPLRATPVTLPMFSPRVLSSRGRGLYMALRVVFLQTLQRWSQAYRKHRYHNGTHNCPTSGWA